MTKEKPFSATFKLEKETKNGGYLEGETLSCCLEKGTLPLDQALRYAIEIADALDHAHRHGVVHRDLRPGNVMLTKSGANAIEFLAESEMKYLSVSSDVHQRTTLAVPPRCVPHWKK